jgi:hypothetical protein
MSQSMGLPEITAADVGSPNLAWKINQALRILAGLVLQDTGLSGPHVIGPGETRFSGKLTAAEGAEVIKLLTLTGDTDRLGNVLALRFTHGLSVYESNEAALAGGLHVGDTYVTSCGYIREVMESTGPCGGGTLYHRTLLLKDTSAGSDIADHVTAYASGVALRAVGVLRLPIAADLVVRVNLNGSPMVTVTIPAATAVDTPVVVEAEEFEQTELADGDVFSWDVLASDGQIAGAGVASIWVGWQ